jgi:hypothetical protein
VRLLQREVARVAKNPNYERHTAIVRKTGTTAQQFPFFKRKLRAAKRFANADGRAVIAELQGWDGSYARTAADDTVDPGVAIWEELKVRIEQRLTGRMGPGADILSGSTGTSHQFDITNGEAAGLRLQGPRDFGKAADATAAALAARFGSADPAGWREPRRMYEVSAQGAASVDDLPFFDRGTWEQSVMLGPGG